MAFRFTLLRKGLILVILPLVFQIAFLIILGGAQGNRAEAQTRTLQSREILTQAEIVLRSLLDAETSVRGFLLSRDRSFLASFELAQRETPTALERLCTLVKDNPPRLTEAREIQDKSTRLFR